MALLRWRRESATGGYLMASQSERCGQTLFDPPRYCPRRGLVVPGRRYPNGEPWVRCWQHDPYRGIDEGEEAYREHTAVY